MNVRLFTKIALCIATVFMQPVYARLSSLSYNDPFPAYTTGHPFDFLYVQERAAMRGRYPEESSRISFSVTPFYQAAKHGRNSHGERTELGDIHGRWSMPGLLYGNVPCDQRFDEALSTAFITGQFCDTPLVCATPDPSGAPFFRDPTFADPNQRFGFFTAPLKYQKTGLRFEMTGMLTNNIGMQIAGGFADIKQHLLTNCRDLTAQCTCLDIFGNPVPALGDVSSVTLGSHPALPCPIPCSSGSADPDTLTACRLVYEGLRGLINLTPQAYGGPYVGLEDTTYKLLFEQKLNQEKVDSLLMLPYLDIFDQMGLDISAFHETSLEDLQVSLFWRHAFALNRRHSTHYPELLLVPFVTADGSIGLSKTKNPAKAFAASFGNNSHHAAGFSAGFTVDFYTSAEIGISAGLTHFFKQQFNSVFVPTHERQSTIFPFKTDICVKPGTNWHFTALASAYHFMKKLSFHAQYIYVTHKEDTICLLGSNNGYTPSSDSITKTIVTYTAGAENVFKPARLARDSAWSSHMVDLAFNYDISPYATLGFLWQIPISREAAYTSHTLAGSFEARF